MNQAFFFRATLMAGLLALGACKKENGTDAPVNVGGFLESGTWHVQSFTDGGQDETAHFSGYAFTFAANGTVTATNSVTTATGFWGAGIADGSSKLTLAFQSPFDFQDLNEDWTVQNANSTRVELSDTSGGGGMHALILERN